MNEHHGFPYIRRNVCLIIYEKYIPQCLFFISVQQTVGTSRLYLSYICLLSASGNWRFESPNHRPTHFFNTKNNNSICGANWRLNWCALLKNGCFRLSKILDGGVYRRYDMYLNLCVQVACALQLSMCACITIYVYALFLFFVHTVHIPRRKKTERIVLQWFIAI
jgi:hypothetical protein